MILTFVLVLYYLTYVFHMTDGGHIIMHSPPFDEIKNNKTYKNKTGYMISKYGMTMTAMGISEEFLERVLLLIQFGLYYTYRKFYKK